MKDDYPEFTKQELGEFLDRGNKAIPYVLGLFFLLGLLLGFLLNTLLHTYCPG